MDQARGPDPEPRARQRPPPARPPLPPPPPARSPLHPAPAISPRPGAAPASAIPRTPGPPTAGPPGVSSVAVPVRLGRYDVRGELGRGGMGVVLRALDPQLDREVAIKLVLDPSRLGERGRERLQREARAVARLQHPGIVGVHEAGEQDGRPYLVMDIVEGRTLEQAVAADEVSPRRLAEHARDIALALEHAHGAGVLHRDVKPENVLIDADGRPRLVDFGLARTHDSAGLTRSGEMLGTPHYVAPEQARGELDAVGPRSDVYGLGGVLYHGLTRRPPFDGETMLAILAQVFEADPTPPRALNPRVHRDLETIAMRCLEKDPERRYPSAGAVAEDLERFLADEPIRARPIGRLGRASRWARRNRLLSAAIVAAALALGAVAGALAGMRAETRRRLQAERGRVLDELRARAAERTEAFERARAGTTGATGGERERLLTLGLDALGAAEALRGAAALGDAALRAEATRAAFEVAIASGEVALADEQWSVAASCFDRASRLGIDRERASAAVASVEQARRARVLQRRAAIERVLELARATDRLASRAGYEDALFTLTRWPEAQTLDLVIGELAGLTDRLREAKRRTYLEVVEPTEAERAAGQKRLDGLAEALERALAAPPGEPLSGSDKGVIWKASQRIAERAAGGRPGPRGDTGAYPGDEVIAAAQARAIEPTGVDRLRLCCEALGRLGIRARAVEALADYLFVEHDQRRAVVAGRALCLLGGPEAERLLLAARERWTRWSPFWRQTEDYLERTGVDTELQGETSEAYYERALVRQGKGELKAALADLQRAVELDQSNFKAWTELAGIKQNIEPPDYEGSVADATRALEINPEHTLALIHRGFASIRLDRFERALADFERVDQLDPDHNAILWCRGLARWEMGDQQGALADFDAAIERAPSRRPYLERGRLRLQMKDFEGAVADLRRVTELDQSDDRAWHSLARALWALGEHDGAIEAIDRSLALAPVNQESLLTRAEIRRSIGDLGPALADADQVLELQPDHLRGRLLRAMLRSSVGDRRGAIEDYDVAIEVRPDVGVFWNNRAYARLCLGELDLALADVSKAVEIGPADPSAWTTRGEVWLARGELAAAIADLTRAIGLAGPPPGIALQRRAQARLLEGDRAGAEADWEKARAIDPALPAAIGPSGIAAIDARLALPTGEGSPGEERR